MRTHTSSFTIGMALLAACAAGCGSDGDGSDDGGSTTTDPPKPTVFVTSSHANATHHHADDTDQDREEEWNAEVGASFIANLGDDDWNGIRDADDDVVNGGGDYWDMAGIVTRAWPKAPDGAIGHLTIDPESAESVRVFKVLPDQTAVPILGSTGACTAPTDCFFTYETTFTTDEVRSGLYLVIEARRFKGQWLASFPLIDAKKTDEAKKHLWSGLVDLAYDIKEADGTPVTTEANPTASPREDARGALSAARQPGSTTCTVDRAAFRQWQRQRGRGAGVTTPKSGRYSKVPQEGGRVNLTEAIFQTGWRRSPRERVMASCSSPPAPGPPRPRRERIPIRWSMDIDC